MVPTEYRMMSAHMRMHHKVGQHKPVSGEARRASLCTDLKHRAVFFLCLVCVQFV